MTSLRLLVTGDENVNSPGYRSLWRLASSLGKCSSVCPVGPNSFSGHRVTVHRSLELKEVAPHRYSLTGTPVDCVRIALTSLSPDIDWVLSGINAGGNLGSEIFSSATIAAAREATLLGYKAISISHLKSRQRQINWTEAVKMSFPIIRALVNGPLERGSFWNVNIPSIPDGGEQPEVIFRPLDPTPLDIEYRRDGNTFKFLGQRHKRPILPGHDVESALAGKITVTRLSIKGPWSSSLSQTSYVGGGEGGGASHGHGHGGGGGHYF